MASEKSPAPSRRTGGRVTPKGGPSPKKSKAPTADGPSASTRYTPPIPKSAKESPAWLPWLMFALFLLGVVVIFLHYVEVLLPGATSAWWLLGGLGLILGGIIVATQYR